MAGERTPANPEGGQTAVEVRVDHSTSASRIAAIVNYLEELQQLRPSVRLGADRSTKGGKTLGSILGAARAVFLREGHAGLSMRMVANEAGIALGNLSYYFPSKRSLLEAMLQEELADYVDAHLNEIKGEGRSPLAILLNVVSFYIGNARRSHQFFLQMWGYAASDSNARELVRGLYRPIGRFILALVKEANPALTEPRARQIVLQIFSLEEGLKLFVALGSDAPDADSAIVTAEIDFRELVRRIVEAG